MDGRAYNSLLEGTMFDTEWVVASDLFFQLAGHYGYYYQSSCKKGELLWGSVAKLLNFLEPTVMVSASSSKLGK